MKALPSRLPPRNFYRSAFYLLNQSRAALLPRGGGAYRGYCGGCPVSNFIAPRDHKTAKEGIPVRYVANAPRFVPAYLDVGIAALGRALPRSRISVYDPSTVDLLCCLQNVHDLIGMWEWRDRLTLLARQFGLCADPLRQAT